MFIHILKAAGAWCTRGAQIRSKRVVYQGLNASGGLLYIYRLREALHILKVMKLWTFSVAPLAPPPLIHGHLGGSFIVILVVLS